MLKQRAIEITGQDFGQPPSGGCVLKHPLHAGRKGGAEPAAFGRLCVETYSEAELSFISATSRLRAAVC